MTVEKINRDKFESVLNNDKGVVVKFFATWCGPCKQYAPIFEEISEEETQINFFEIDVDENPDIASRYSITTIPSFIFLKNGELKEKQVGRIPKEEFKDKIQVIS